MADDPSRAAQQAQGSYIAQAVQGGTATVQVYHSSTPPQEQNRARFLKRLHYSYGELWEQSLQGASLIALGLTKKPDAVEHHTSLLFLSRQQPERPLPPGTSIVQAYEEAGQELLILGEPGAGKSTLLLDLARHLVDRAEQDVGQPLPIIVPLSSWAEKRPPFHDWLAEQVALLYDIPYRLSQSWVQQNRFLPLLDGLDEVPQSARIACIEAMVAYRKEHLVPLVVCSRRAEYEQIARHQRLTLHSAVVVQPLTSQQVDAYLVQAGEPLTAVRTVLSTNHVLADLTTTPLMLSIVTLTYIDASAQDLPHKGSAQEQLQAVFATYIQRMVERKGNSVRYPLERTKMWLGWLARQMHVHNQTVFYLEHVQPDWLPTRRRALYRWSVGLVFGLVSGLVSGLVFGLVGGLVFGLVVGLVFGLGGGLLGGLLGGLDTKIELAEALTWSWKEARSGLVFGLVFGLVVGLVFGLVVGLVFGLVVGLVFGLVVGLVVGLSRKQLTERLMLSPNEGIRRSVKNGLIFGLLVGLLSGLLVWLGGGLLGGLLSGLVLGLLAGLLGGLDAALHHATLRFWLWRTCPFPWRTVSFLDDATARILLRRVGGGYSFTHRLLLDYFTSL